MFLRFILALTLCTVVVQLFGQRISGFVRDSMGAPLPYATVVAASGENQKVLAYASTDEQGYFQLNFDIVCDSIKLTARRLAFQNVSIRISCRDPIPVQQIYMTQTVLQEVHIIAKAPAVIANKDTIEYNVASFSDSTEFSVEDLLRKLPGIQVSENGRISFNGKTVERVLIEGDNLFDQNYAIATRNLRANMISKVQAIDHYQENPLLKGISESERLVLNLKIKDEKKRFTSGSISTGLGYGAELKGAGHTNLFSLTRKYKSYLIGNGNNVSDNSINSLEQINASDYFDKNRMALQDNPLKTPILVNRPAMDYFGLPPSHTSNNCSGMVYWGNVLPLTPVFKLTVSSWLVKGYSHQQTNTENLYFWGEDTLLLQEDKKKEIISAAWNIQSEAEYFPTRKNQSLRCFVKISGSPESAPLLIERIQKLNPSDSIPQRLNAKSLSAFGAAEYTLKIQQNALFQATAKFSCSNRKTNLQTDYNFYPFYFGLDTTFTHLFQNADQSHHNRFLNFKYLTNKWSINWTLEGGINWERSQLISDIFLQNRQDSIKNVGTNYENNFTVNIPIYFLRTSMLREWDFWTLRFRAGSSTIPFKLSAPQIQNGNKIQRLQASEIQLIAQYHFTEQTLIAASLDFQQNLPAYNDLIPGSIFTDYQTIQKGESEIEVSPRYSCSIRFTHRHPSKQIFLNLFATLIRRENGLGSQFQINPYFFVINKYRPVGTANYLFGGTGSRFYPSLNSRLELGINLLKSRFEKRINSALPQSIDNTIFNLNFEYGSAFDTWINVIFKSRASFSNVKIHQEQLTNKFNGLNWISQLQLTIKPPYPMDLKLTVYRIASRNGSGNPITNFASESTAQFRIPKWRSECRVSALNLFNSSRYGQVFADDFVQTSSFISAVSPWFLISWEFNF